MSGNIEEEEPIQVTEDEVLDVMEKILVNNNSTVLTKQYAVTAIMKLSTRFSSSISRIRKLINIYSTSTNTELQQRSVEYTSLFGSHDSMRTGLLERMPLIEKNKPANPGLANGDTNAEEDDLVDTEESVKPIKEAKAKDSNNILDLLDDVQPTPTSVNPEPVKSSGGDLLDLLGGLDTSTGPPPPLSGSLLDGFGSVQPVNQVPSVNSQPLISNGTAIPSIKAFEKNGLKIEFSFERKETEATMMIITLSATNSNPAPLNDFVFQAAVPKSFQLQLSSPSGSVVPANSEGALTQVIKVNNPQKQHVRMRIRMNYNFNGTPVTEQGEVNNIPTSAWQ